MNQITALPVIPPAQKFHFQPNDFERGPGLFNLNLDAAMSQQERAGVIEQDFHLPKNVMIQTEPVQCQCENPG